jgi:hypothetical protein
MKMPSQRRLSNATTSKCRNQPEVRMVNFARRVPQHETYESETYEGSVVRLRLADFFALLARSSTTLANPRTTSEVLFVLSAQPSTPPAPLPSALNVVSASSYAILRTVFGSLVQLMCVSCVML